MSLPIHLRKCTNWPFRGNIFWNFICSATVSWLCNEWSFLLELFSIFQARKRLFTWRVQGRLRSRPCWSWLRIYISRMSKRGRIAGFNSSDFFKFWLIFVKGIWIPELYDETLLQALQATNVFKQQIFYNTRKHFTTEFTIRKFVFSIYL